MAGRNSGLHGAKQAKNDEFYTQYQDIEKEIKSYLEHNPDVFRDKVVLLPCDDPEWSNFTKYFAQCFIELGLKKLISTSCVKPKYDGDNTDDSVVRGKILTLTSDVSRDDIIDFHGLEWDYLQGNGDFRSDEVTKLRDEADFVITNPPFSLFREFLAWIIDGDKKFSIIGNMNAITYKDVFPLFKSNEMWLGCTISSGDREFRVPYCYPLEAAGFRVDDNGNKFIKVKGVRWFTNIENGRRHKSLDLETMDDNLLSNSQIKKNPNSYQKYENYNAIEVPRTDGIPSDYEGVMGVPISFLDKYCPDQFEILDANDWRCNDKVRDKPHGLIKDKDGMINGKPTYARILIRHKNPTKKEINNAN